MPQQKLLVQRAEQLRPGRLAGPQLTLLLGRPECGDLRWLGGSAGVVVTVTRYILPYCRSDGQRRAPPGRHARRDRAASAP